LFTAKTELNLNNSVQSVIPYFSLLKKSENPKVQSTYKQTTFFASSKVKWCASDEY